MPEGLTPAVQSKRPVTAGTYSTKLHQQKYDRFKFGTNHSKNRMIYWIMTIHSGIKGMKIVSNEVIVELIMNLEPIVASEKKHCVRSLLQMIAWLNRKINFTLEEINNV